MGKKTKPFIDKKTAAHFHVVHRSLHDEVCILVLVLVCLGLVLALFCVDDAFVLSCLGLGIDLALFCVDVAFVLSCLVLSCLVLVLPVSVYPSAVRVSLYVCQLVCLRVSSLVEKTKEDNTAQDKGKDTPSFCHLSSLSFYCLVFFLLGCRRRERL
jgi:hypothetical protein